MSVTGRNDLCPCGSGKKYKKCCGTVVPIVASPSPASSAHRECGECAACCEGWLTGTVFDQELKPGGTKCRYIRPGGGCGVYEQRPQQPCREFICGWLTPNNPFPESFKPTLSGVIIYPTQWRGMRAYRLVPAGRDPAPAMLEWMARFSQQTGIPFFYEIKGETMGYGPQIFVQDMQQRIARGESLW
jgi:hypothetical protein